MILSTDDYPRIFEQIEEERGKVQYYLRKNAHKLKKRLMSTLLLPVWHCETITMPKSKNRYLLYYYTDSEKDIVSGRCISGAPLLLTGEDGKRCAITCNRMLSFGEGTEGRVWELQVYTGHFFSRYKERMKLPATLTPDEVIAFYFGRNGRYLVPLNHDDIVLKKNRDKSNSAWAIDDGVTLADAFSYSGFSVIKHKTFLSRSELKPGQDEATPSRFIMREACINYRK